MDVVDVGEVSDGVSEPAPGAESMDSGAGDPSASPLFPSAPAGLTVTFVCPTTRGAGLSVEQETSLGYSL